MKIHTLKSEVWVPRSREEVFEFFSRAENLEALTPHWLHFSILSPGSIAMKTGARIKYQLRLHGIPLRWESKITAWEPPRATGQPRACAASTSSWSMKEAPKYETSCNTLSPEAVWYTGCLLLQT